MPPLERAVALEEVDGVAVRIGQELDLDVLGAVDELFEVDAAVAERGLGFVAGGLERAEEAGLLSADAHPLAAAARRGFDEDGVADLAGDPGGLGVAGDGSVGARYAGDLGGVGDGFRLGLQAHLADGLVGRPDELELAGPADLGEVGVLRQEAVTRVDGLHAGNLGRRDDPGDVQVAVRAGGFADADGSVGQLKIRRAAVGLRIHGDDLHAQFLAGADDAEGDFAPVGDEDSLKHKRLAMIGVWSS